MELNCLLEFAAEDLSLDILCKLSVVVDTCVKGNPTLPKFTGET